MRVYEEDRSVEIPIRFLVRGEGYKLLGLFESDLRLFGTDDGGTIFLFGTDTLGRDLLSQVIHASRISLSIGLIGVFLSLFIGLIMGGIAGFYGGTVDELINRFMEILLSFPSIPLWMALSAALPPTWSMLQVYFGITVILSLVGWTGLARQIRGRILSIKAEDYIVAARLTGCSTSRIIGAYMLPMSASHIIASLTLSIPGMILGETALSFLGIGLRRPTVSWGVLLRQAQDLQMLFFGPWLLIPGIFVVLAVLAFNFLGDGIRDASDPYHSSV